MRDVRMAHSVLGFVERSVLSREKEEGGAQIGKRVKVEIKSNIGSWSTRKAIRKS